MSVWAVPFPASVKMVPTERVRQEERLRGAVLAGDSGAWRALYDGAFAELWTYVLWRTGGARDVAEEITQETWLVAVRRIAEFEPHRGPFLGWLRGIAANALRNYFRSRSHAPKRILADVPAVDGSRTREEAELIALALADLPERAEMVLRAKYLDGMSVEQIAAEWEETEKAIESLLSRARQAFREAYERRAGLDVAFQEKKP